MADPETGPDPLRDRILDAAVASAEEDAGWYDLRLHVVARRLDLPLATVLDHFQDADAVADAWFARALRAMLREPEPGFDALPPSARVAHRLSCWGLAACTRRRISRCSSESRPRCCAAGT